MTRISLNSKIKNWLTVTMFIAATLFKTETILAGNAEDKIIKVTVAVNQFVNHQALDIAYNGLLDSLQKAENEELSGKVKFDVLYANSQGNISNSAQISKHHASLEPDFMIGIATPSAQTNKRAVVDDKTINGFLAVSDAKEAGLITDEINSNSNDKTDQQENSDILLPKMIGVTDHPPVAELIEKAQKVFPNLKTIGVIYNPGEINSVKTIERLKEILGTKGLELKTATISNSNDIKIALSKILPEIDVIYLPQDNTVISALDNVAAIAKKAQKPIISNDPELVKKGVFMALGINYYQSGQLLGKMVVKAVKIKNNLTNESDPKNTEDKTSNAKNNSWIIQPTEYELRFNDPNAENLGVTL